MKVAVKELLAELQWVNRFCGTKSTIPIVQNVLFDLDGVALTLTGTDLEMGGITRLIGTSPDHWSVAVPVGGLIKYLSKVEDPEVDLSATPSHHLVVSHGTSVSRVSGMSKGSFPELPAFPAAQATLGKFPLAIERTIFAVSKEESRFTLNGALLLIEEDEAKLIATDGHRLALAPLQARGKFKGRALVPRCALTEAGRLEGDVAFSLNEDHIFLDYGRRKIVARKLSGNFPDYERVMPNDMANHCYVPVQTMTKTLERVAVYADERSHAVVFTVGDGALTIKASSVESGEAEGKVPIHGGVYNPLAQYGLNAEYVLDFLKRVDSTLVAWCWAADDPVDPDNPDDKRGKANTKGCQFATDDAWRYVVCPMRI